MSTLQAKNEAIIDAPVRRVWAIITDINLLHKVNPNVVKALGRMDRLGETRTCEIDSKGRKGKMTGTLIEFVPEQKTVWTIQSDTMGMSKMLKNTRFCFYLEPLGDNKTKITNETYYQPVNFIAMLMDVLMMKKMIGKAQEQILLNLKLLAENKHNGI